MGGMALQKAVMHKFGTTLDGQLGLQCLSSHDTSESTNRELPSIVACTWSGGHVWPGYGSAANLPPLASHLIAEVLLAQISSPILEATVPLDQPQLQLLLAVGAVSSILLMSTLLFLIHWVYLRNFCRDALNPPSPAYHPLLS